MLHGVGGKLHPTTFHTQRQSSQKFVFLCGIVHQGICRGQQQSDVTMGVPIQVRKADYGLSAQDNKIETTWQNDWNTSFCFGRQILTIGVVKLSFTLCAQASVDSVPLSALTSALVAQAVLMSGRKTLHESTASTMESLKSSPPSISTQIHTPTPVKHCRVRMSAASTTHLWPRSILENVLPHQAWCQHLSLS